MPPRDATLSAPVGPLEGDEFHRAVELLTDRQRQAYAYFRSGQHTMGWIATRLGCSRQAARQLIRKAEKRLGYEPSFNEKQKTAYKPVAQRQQEAHLAKLREVAEAIRGMTPQEQRQMVQRLKPDAPSRRDDRANLQLLIELMADALADPAAKELMRSRVAGFERRAQRDRQRERRQQSDEIAREMGLSIRSALTSPDDDFSRAVGDEAAEFAATLEADFGLNPATGVAMRPEDFVADDGKGYDR
jgi:predicted DNA-binding protein YlxM (UPF0122 family)